MNRVVLLQSKYYCRQSVFSSHCSHVLEFTRLTASFSSSSLDSFWHHFNTFPFQHSFCSMHSNGSQYCLKYLSRDEKNLYSITYLCMSIMYLTFTVSERRRFVGKCWNRGSNGHLDPADGVPSCDCESDWWPSLSHTRAFPLQFAQQLHRRIYLSLRVRSSTLSLGLRRNKCHVECNRSFNTFWRFEFTPINWYSSLMKLQILVEPVSSFQRICFACLLLQIQVVYTVDIRHIIITSAKITCCLDEEVWR